jgi:hypothetical protein
MSDDAEIRSDENGLELHYSRIVGRPPVKPMFLDVHSLPTCDDLSKYVE